MKTYNKRIIVVSNLSLMLIIGIFSIFSIDWHERQGGYIIIPGVPGYRISDDQIIRVGVIGPLSDSQGKNQFRGAYLAAWEINAAGGIFIGNSTVNQTYYIALVFEDTKESIESPSIEDALNAVVRFKDVKLARYFIGGFSSEMVRQYREEILDDGRIFLGTGAATADLCENLTDPSVDDKYKYWFRISPHNSDMQGYDVVHFVQNLMKMVPTAAAEFENVSDSPYEGCNASSFSISRVTILREANDLTVGLAAYIESLINSSVTVVKRSFASGLQPEAWQSIWESIDDDGTQITIPLVSQFSSISMIQSYRKLADLNQVKTIIAGVDMSGSVSKFWDQTNGACEGEITTVSGAGLGVDYAAKSKLFYTR